MARKVKATARPAAKGKPKAVKAKPKAAQRAGKKAAPKAKVQKAKTLFLPALVPKAMALQSLDLRYPYTGFRYRAEGPQRIRVDRGNMWGYFDADGRWLEGPLRAADGPFCRYMASNWRLAHRGGHVK